MSATDVIIIGAGHNGLVTAFYLAKAGLKPLLLEAREVAGGCVASETVAPGFIAPLANAIGPLRPDVVRDMGLAQAVNFLRPDPRLVALNTDGRAIVFSSEMSRTVDSIRAFSANDATRYPEFCSTLERFGGFLTQLLDIVPPDIDRPAAGEVWDLLKTGRKFRSLGKADAFRLLRWGPMAAADLVAEFFDTDLLQATIAARGVYGTAQGPWSAGSGAVLLLNAAFDPAPGGSSISVKGGHAALARAMAAAAERAGATIRTSSPVAQVIVRGGRAAGVLLKDGSEITAHAVVSNVDPRRTFLDLVDPVELDPGFLQKVRNYRARGTVAKVHLALNGLPTFSGVANPADLHGRIHLAPGIDYLERSFDASKYGAIPAEPYLDVTIPSLSDPTLAPEGKHVLSAHVQFVPYRLAGGEPWEQRKAALAQTVVATLQRFAPGLEPLIEAAQVLTPVDLETQYGLTGGQIYHGEPALDQLFTMRPMLGYARYATPIDGLFLCGSGTHPAGGITGASGANAAREIRKHVSTSRT